MAKMLNLDELAQADRVLKINGKEHAMVEVTVGAFIEISKMQEELEGQDELPMSRQMELTIDLIRKRFPTIEEDELKNMSVSHLNAILEFARQPDEEADGEGK